MLVTLVLLFGFQGNQILSQPLIIALLAIPILIQVHVNAGLAYALIGASNFFELAVAYKVCLSHDS